MCACASINPGMSVRPPPLTIVTFALRSAGIGDTEILSILLLRTKTFDGADSALPLPSKMRTFWNRMKVGCTSWASTTDAVRQATARDDFHNPPSLRRIEPTLCSLVDAER